MYNKKRVCAIVTARMTNTRLPGKNLLKLNDKPALQHIHERLSKVKYIDDIVIAIPADDLQNEIIKLCDKYNWNYYMGSNDDVLDRILCCAKFYSADVIVDITGDCPLVCPKLVEEMIADHGRNKYSYVSNVISRTFPRGFDIQVFNTSLLESIAKEVDNPVDRQHVTSWHYLNPKNHDKHDGMNIYNTDGKNIANYSRVRLTLDTTEDYMLLDLVFRSFKDNDFTYDDVQKLIEQYPEMFMMNQNIEQKSYYDELSNYYLYGESDEKI